MSEFLFAVASILLVTVALGLFRILRGSGEVDRLMAAQLVGSGGVAVLLLLAVVMGTSAIIDVAMMLALLAAFASVAFVNKAVGLETAAPDGATDR